MVFFLTFLERRLLKAAQLGYVNEVKRALAEGADVNARHTLGWTALHVAAINGRLGAVKVLLEAGADPNLGDEFTDPKRIALTKGLHSWQGNLSIINDFNLTDIDKNIF